MKHYLMTAALLATCTLTACDKKTGEVSSDTSTPEGMIAEAAKVAEVQAKIAALEIVACKVVGVVDLHPGIRLLRSFLDAPLDLRLEGGQKVLLAEVVACLAVVGRKLRRDRGVIRW